MSILKGSSDKSDYQSICYESERSDDECAKFIGSGFYPRVIPRKVEVEVTSTNGCNASRATLVVPIVTRTGKPQLPVLPFAISEVKEGDKLEFELPVTRTVNEIGFGIPFVGVHHGLSEVGLGSSTDGFAYRADLCVYYERSIAVSSNNQQIEKVIKTESGKTYTEQLK